MLKTFSFVNIFSFYKIYKISNQFSKNQHIHLAGKTDFVWYSYDYLFPCSKILNKNPFPMFRMQNKMYKKLKKIQKIYKKKWGK